jgi:hypothetical protein
VGHKNREVRELLEKFFSINFLNFNLRVILRELLEMLSEQSLYAYEQYED